MIPPKRAGETSEMVEPTPTAMPDQAHSDHGGSATERRPEVLLPGLSMAPQGRGARPRPTRPTSSPSRPPVLRSTPSPDSNW